MLEEIGTVDKVPAMVKNSVTFLPVASAALAITIA